MKSALVGLTLARSQIIKTFSSIDSCYVKCYGLCLSVEGHAHHCLPIQPRASSPLLGYSLPRLEALCFYKTEWIVLEGLEARQPVSLLQALTDNSASLSQQDSGPYPLVGTSFLCCGDLKPCYHFIVLYNHIYIIT